MAKKKQLDARDIFQRTLRVCSDLLDRVDRAMNGVGAKKRLDPDTIKAAKELGTLVNQMTKTQESMNAKGMAHITTMSQSEQFGVALRFIVSLPIGYRTQAAEELTASLKKKAK